jgi:uncharacterized protein YjbI with pentapeptide repeats
MIRLLKSRDYLMKCLLFVLLFGFISLGAIGGCSNNNGEGQGSTGTTIVLTENDFADEPALTANLETDNIITFLEPLSQENFGNDTSSIGEDILPIRINNTTNLTICWQDDNPSAEHKLMFIDSSNNTVLSHVTNDNCADGLVQSGNYNLKIKHDGNTDEEFTVFIVPEGGDGNLQLSVFTNRCNDCQLEGSNLEGADLRNTDISGSNMRNSDFLSAKIGLNVNTLGLNESSTTLRTTDLTDTDFSGSTWNNGATCEEGSVGQCIQSSNGDRIITLHNQCNQDIWLGFVGAGLHGGDKKCNTDADCGSGQKCNLLQHICQWSLPAPTNGTFHLSKSGEEGDQVVFNIPASQAIGSGNDSQISNINYYAQTGCQNDVGNCSTGPCGGNCVTASCLVDGKTDQPCSFGTGPKGPHTEAELNLFRDIQDSYDVSNIDGTNIPIEILPSKTNTSLYDCGNPGGITAVNNGLKGCTWKFNPTVENSDYGGYLRYILQSPDLQEECGKKGPGGSFCPGSDEECGIIFKVPTDEFFQGCGKQVGWYNPNELCKIANNGKPFPSGIATTDKFINCSRPNIKDLLSCSGINGKSCYTPSGPAGPDCCGCPSWSKDLTTYPPCNSTDPFCCNGQNEGMPSWRDVALPFATIAKEACPTAYSYQYDDVTVSFNCPSGFQGNPSNPNTMNYTIIFCPDGVTAF